MEVVLSQRWSIVKNHFAPRSSSIDLIAPFFSMASSPAVKFRHSNQESIAEKVKKKQDLYVGTYFALYAITKSEDEACREFRILFPNNKDDIQQCYRRARDRPLKTKDEDTIGVTAVMAWNKAHEVDEKVTKLLKSKLGYSLEEYLLREHDSRNQYWFKY